MKAKEFIPASKPRNFVAKNQKTAGAGAHKDKKRADKQGDVKHKNKQYEEGVAEGIFGIDSRIKGKIQNITSDLSDVPGNWDHERQTFTNAGIEKLRSALNDNPKYIKYALSLTADDYEAENIKERVRDPEDWDEGDTEPPNNFAVYINGKKWKVFKGRGQFADDYKEIQHYRQLQNWAQEKSQATGKKWEVHRTGEAPTA
jgi:hypothetical protein